MKNKNSKIYELDGFDEAYDDYYFTNATDRNINLNNLFVGRALETLGEYLILPALINKNFGKFINEFFSAHTCFTLKNIEQDGDVYIVTIRNIKEKKLQKTVWVLKNHFSSKSINVNVICLLKRMLKKHKAITGVIVSTTSVLCSTSVKSIGTSRYCIYFIDQQILNKYTIWLSQLRSK